MERWFEKDVETAVSHSTTQCKPLVVYIAPVKQDSDDSDVVKEDTNELSSDSLEASDDSWLDSWFQMDEEWLQKAIWLKLVDSTTEFRYFDQIFHCSTKPSIYVIFKGKIEVIIDNSNKDSQFEDNWDNLIAKLLELTLEIEEQNHSDGNKTNETNQSSTNKQPESKHTTFKEKVIETAQQHYRSEVQKERVAARKERERILELLKADREERKNKERELLELSQKPMENIENDEIINESITDNFKDKTKLQTETCSLQIKLTNGSNLKHIFNSHDTLNDVRSWIDRNRTDNDIPFAFHRNVPRQTFSDSDELKSLQDLELTPRSSLILKPLQPINRDSNIAESQDPVNPNILGKVYNGLSSWWNRSHSNSPSATSIPPAKKMYNVSNDSHSNLTHENENNINNDNSTNNNSTRENSNKNKKLQPGNATPIARRSTDVSASRSLTPNIVKFVNSNDKSNTDDDDDEKETYNGNTIKLEKSNKDKHGKSDE